MRKFNVDWRIIFWLGIIIILLWIIAKKSGLFNTPLIIELIPYFGGIISIMAFVREFGSLTNKLDNVISDVSDIRTELKEVRIDIKDIRNELHVLDKRVSVLESRI